MLCKGYYNDFNTKKTKPKGCFAPPPTIYPDATPGYVSKVFILNVEPCM